MQAKTRDMDKDLVFVWVNNPVNIPGKYAPLLHCIKDPRVIGIQPLTAWICELLPINEFTFLPQQPTA